MAKPFLSKSLCYCIIDAVNQSLAEKGHGFNMYLPIGNKDGDRIPIVAHALNIGEGIGAGIIQHGRVGELIVGENVDGLIFSAQQGGYTKVNP